MELVDGPWFDDLAVGDRFDGAPGVTLTSGMAAVHQSVLGDRLRLSLDDELARAVVGSAPLAHPALVWDVAIGQSTVVTRQVRANLFYRGLAFHRFPVIGDTLRTVTEVVGLRENTRRPERAPTGLAALRITTVDQEDRAVLDFWRCAMLPLRSQAATGHRDDLSTIGGTTVPVAPDWDLAAFRARVPDEHVEAMTVGRRWRVPGGDVVSNAPELARLTANIAAVHHGVQPRLVYGGHTIGIALGQVCRAIPNLVTVVSWDGCDHVGPVHEGDVLTSEVEVLAVAGNLVSVKSTVDSTAGTVLDWRFTAVLA